MLTAFYEFLIWATLIHLSDLGSSAFRRPSAGWPARFSLPLRSTPSAARSIDRPQSNTSATDAGRTTSTDTGGSSPLFVR